MNSQVSCNKTLSRIRNKLELILAHTGEGIYGLDKMGKTTFVNRAAAAMVGLNYKEMHGICNHTMVHHHYPDGQHYPQDQCPIYATLQDGKPRRGDNEYFWRAKDNSFFPIEYFVTPIIEQGEISGAVVTFIDISERKLTEQKLLNYQTKLEDMVATKTQELTELNIQLQKMAMVDGLTNIGNRRGFNDALDKETRRAARFKKSLTLLLLDVDFFKKYNDSYGHPAGDRCLQKIAQALQNVFKRSTDFVARYGGEEFAIILPETNHDAVILQVEALQREMVQLDIQHNTSTVSKIISLSIGIAHFVPNPEDAQRFIDIADKALYQAKNNGRNRWSINLK